MATFEPTYEQLYDSAIRVLTEHAKKPANQFDGNQQHPHAFHLANFVNEIDKDIKTFAGNVAMTGAGISINAADAQVSEERKAEVRFIIWQLVVSGMLIPGQQWGKDTTSLNLPFFMLTQLGINALKSGKVEPFDPAGYGKRLRDLANIPEAAKEYAREATSCFHRGEFLASLTTLGVANELLLQHLFETVERWLDGDPLQSTLTRAKDKGAKAKAEILEGVLERKRDALDKNTHEKLVSHIPGMMTVIRITRNDAMHPIGPKDFDRSSTLAHLALFVTVASHIDAAIAALPAPTVRQTT